MEEQEILKQAAERVMAHHPLWPAGLPEEGPFSIPAGSTPFIPMTSSRRATPNSLWRDWALL